MIERIYELIRQVGREYAPDPRVALFEVGVAHDEENLVLYGATTEPEAATALCGFVASADPDVPVRDDILRLPVSDDGFLTRALVRAASAPMLAGPLISESPLSQVILGQPMVVLREYGRWLQCRSPDRYIGWIHRGYLTRLSDPDARAWEEGSVAPLHFSLGAEVVDERGAVTARLPWGSRVGVDGENVRLPDGSTGRLRGPTIPVADLPAHFPTDGEAIVETAKGWIGTPYLWGGITPAGADCSGLVQAVYRAHGIALPRDSDQQARVVEPLEPGDDFGALAPGDLLFFAEEGDRVSHVAISRGGSKIIHSALGNGGVRTNDLLGERGEERELRSLFAWAIRVIPPAP